MHTYVEGYIYGYNEIDEISNTSKVGNGHSYDFQLSLNSTIVASCNVPIKVNDNKNDYGLAFAITGLSLVSLLI